MQNQQCDWEGDRTRNENCAGLKRVGRYPARERFLARNVTIITPLRSWRLTTTGEFSTGNRIDVRHIHVEFEKYDASWFLAAQNSLYFHNPDDLTRC
jgi:hypothetical protein